jgi:hypothetical protein
MACSNRQLVQCIATGGLTFLLAAQSFAQNPPARMRGTPAQQQAPPPFVAVPQMAATAPPQGNADAVQPALSLLQQPAKEARILFTGNSLTIHADNSSLTAILHQFSTTSGMRINGLGNDERVFGNFGPGTPRDVLADLLNGTAYNLVLLGDLSNGAPRELILTPATHGGDAHATSPPPQAGNEEAVPEQESVEVPQPPPPPDVAPAPVTAPTTPGVRTPQQLFEQLQQMRQQQQQQQQQPPPQ